MMRSTMLVPMLILIFIGVTLAGCTEKVEETIDPDLDLKVLEVVAMGQSPAPNAKNSSEGKEFLYVKVNITNDNKKADHTVWDPDRFKVDDNSATQIDGSHLANLDMREIESLIIDIGEGKTFWIVFEVPNDQQMIYIRYEAGLDEPLDSELPSYDHYDGKT
jgi:hypothetical protein